MSCLFFSCHCLDMSRRFLTLATHRGVPPGCRCSITRHQSSRPLPRAQRHSKAWRRWWRTWTVCPWAASPPLHSCRLYDKRLPSWQTSRTTCLSFSSNFALLCAGDGCLCVCFQERHTCVVLHQTNFWCLYHKMDWSSLPTGTVDFFSHHHWCFTAPGSFFF